MKTYEVYLQLYRKSVFYTSRYCTKWPSKDWI